MLSLFIILSFFPFLMISQIARISLVLSLSIWSRNCEKMFVEFIKFVHMVQPQSDEGRYPTVVHDRQTSSLSAIF